MRFIIRLILLVISLHAGEIWSHDTSWEHYVQRAEILEQDGNYMEAFTVIKQGLEAAKRKDTIYADAIDKAENLLDKAGRPDIALSFIMPVHKRWVKKYGINSLPVSVSLKLLIQVYSSLGDTNNALRCGRLMLKSARHETGKDRLSSIAIAKYMLADVYMKKHQYANAKKLYKQAARYFKKDKKKDYLAQIGACYNNLAILANEEGKHQKALSYYKKSLELKSDESNETDSTLYNLGALYVDMGNLQQAKKILVPVLTRREKNYGNQHLKTAVIHNQLGLIAYKEGNYNQALKHFQKLHDFALQRPKERKENLALALENIGSVYQKKSQFSKAEACFNEAYTIRGKTSDFRSKAQTLELLGTVSYNKNEFSQAIKYYKQAIDIFEKNHDSSHPYYANVLSHLGMARLKQKHYSIAEACFNRAIEIKEKATPDSMTLANSLADIGTAYLEQKQYKKAEPLFLRSIAIQKKVAGGSHRKLAYTYNNLARLYSDLHQYKQAIQYNRDAVKIARETLGPNHSSTKLYEKNLKILMLKTTFKILR